MEMKNSMLVKIILFNKSHDDRHSRVKIKIMHEKNI